MTEVKGEFYAEFDENYNMWFVYHTDLFEGKAVASFASKKQAEDHAEELNEIGS